MTLTKAMLGLAAILVAGPGAAGAADPVAYVTEIHKGGGQAQIKTAGAPEWTTLQPLQALREGDQLRVTANARLVVLYHAGGATRTVTGANTPFMVGPPPASSSAQAGTVAAGVAQFLVGKQGPQTYRRAASRSLDAVGEPIMLAPRETRLLPGPVTFEWEGPERVLYRLRVTSPQGVLWEQSDLPRRPVPYPASAPELMPGVHYAWELEAQGQSAQRARFEVVGLAEAGRIRAQLSALDGAHGYPPGTRRVVKVVLLYQADLYQEVRRELEPIAAGSDDPTVHTLLGHVYQRVGLHARAALAFERARALTSGP
jgi:hypothetical protein